MIDEPFRQWLGRSAIAPTRLLMRLGITPNQVTVGALALGLVAAGLVASGQPRTGVLLWLVSRLLDGLDGLLARLSARTSLMGGYLDISCDMLAYCAMAIAFATAMPADSLWWLVVLAGYTMAITTTLALSSLLERARRPLAGDRSLHFTAALAEGGETSGVYVLIAFWPSASRVVLTGWIVLLAITAIQRSRLAWRLL